MKLSKTLASKALVAVMALLFASGACAQSRRQEARDLLNQLQELVARMEKSNPDEESHRQLAEVVKRLKAQLQREMAVKAESNERGDAERDQERARNSQKMREEVQRLRTEIDHERRAIEKERAALRQQAQQEREMMNQEGERQRSRWEAESKRMQEQQERLRQNMQQQEAQLRKNLQQQEEQVRKNLQHQEEQIRNNYRQLEENLRRNAHRVDQKEGGGGGMVMDPRRAGRTENPPEDPRNAERRARDRAVAEKRRAEDAKERAVQRARHVAELAESSRKRADELRERMKERPAHDRKAENEAHQRKAEAEAHKRKVESEARKPGAQGNPRRAGRLGQRSGEKPSEAGKDPRADFKALLDRQLSAAELALRKYSKGATVDARKEMLDWLKSSLKEYREKRDDGAATEMERTLQNAFKSRMEKSFGDEARKALEERLRGAMKLDPSSEAHRNALGKEFTEKFTHAWMKSREQAHRDALKSYESALKRLKSATGRRTPQKRDAAPLPSAEQGKSNPKRVHLSGNEPHPSHDHDAKPHADGAHRHGEVDAMIRDLRKEMADIRKLLRDIRARAEKSGQLK